MLKVLGSTGVLGTSRSRSQVTSSPPSDLEAETQTFVARMAALGASSLPSAQENALDAFFVSAKASTWWSKAHSLRMRLSSEIASEIDLVDQTTQAARSSTPVPWTGALGWKLAGNSGEYLDLKVDPVDVLASENSMALVIYTSTASGSSSRDITGTDASIASNVPDLFLTRRQDRVITRLATTGNSLQNVSDNAPGFTAVSRTSATQIDYYVGDASNAGSDSDVPTGLTARGLTLGDPSNSSSDRGILGAGLFDGLTGVEVLSLRNTLVSLETSFRP